MLVSIDGLRADASHRLDSLRQLRREGTDATNAWTIERSATLPSHASMLTGVDVGTHGLTYNGFRASQGLVRFPTVFRVARRAGLATSMFVSKSKFRHLAEPDGSERFEVAGYNCRSVVSRARETLRSQRDGVLFLHFPNTDSAGHRSGWMSRAYLQAVEAVDQCLADVVTELDGRARENGRVLLIVTSDHGGHGRTHGTRAEVDRRIPWVARGHGAPRRLSIARQISTLDTAATILRALGLPQTPGIAGVPVNELERAAPTPSADQATRRRRTARRRSPR